MNNHVFWLLFSLILVFQFVIRIVPPQNHNFFFTVDQAEDAVWVREIVERGQLILHGAQTNIPGVYSGPLWYYFLAPGYLFFQGDPFGALVMVVLLNVALTGTIMWVIKREVGSVQAIIIGIALLIFWWFYDASRWAFNPFPLVTTAMLTILLLASFLKGNRKALFWAAIPVFLGFNFEIAGATAIFLFYILFAIWAYFKKKVKLWDLVVAFALPFAFASTFALQLGRRFISNQAGQVLPGEATNYFAGTNFFYIAGRFLEIISFAVIPYQPILSLIIFGLLSFYFLQKRGRNTFVQYFFFLTLGLFLVCFLFFGSNKGWYDWHTLFLPVLLFISFLLLILQLPKKYAVLALIVISGIQFLIFQERYLQYLKPSTDAGILANQTKVIDWIYTNSDGDGFNVYAYTSNKLDYNYQYLFYWYGRKTYGFVPCEYSDFPGSLKLHVPGAINYSEPKLGCDWLRYLVIESEKLFPEQEKTISLLRHETILLEQAEINGVTIEKRRVKREEERDK